MKLKYTIFAVILTMLLIVVACTQPAMRPMQPAPVQPNPTITQPKTENVPANDSELKKFSSATEIKEFLQKAGQNQYGESYSGFGGMMRSDVAMEKGVAVPSAAPISAATPGATEFSQTNIQVEGVDEADFVKNDNKYIYMIVQDKLVIVDAYPAEKADVISTTELNGRPVNIFVKGDRLAVFTQENDEIYTIPEYGYMPIPRQSEVTKVYIYDISDRAHPKKVDHFTVSGNYYQSRMIGDYVYFITQEGVWYGSDIIMPKLLSETKVFASPVYYFDIPEQSYNLNTVASFNIKHPEELNAKTFLLGYGTTLYVSQDNIYLAYQKSPGWLYYREGGQTRFFDVVVPLLPQEMQDKVKGIEESKDLSSYEKWDKISAELETMYNGMKENDKGALIDKIEEGLTEYDRRKEIERRKTVIHKIRISDGEIEYESRGEVIGYLLNQFSMDENNQRLRVATTTEIYLPYKGSQMFNNVYVLDSNMETVGKLEGIAPDERIYSTRFVGDRLYMVTFKRIDPLFVIDLKDPANPEILGKLKIPGYSDYLHPYDENHIIGIGKETESNDWGGVSTGGVKLALFDVSDVENPKEVDHVEIGEPGSDSEALRDHKAFLFDKSKNILVIPVREVKGHRYVDPRYGYYTERIWQGAYVFGVDASKGFEEKGKITHLDGNEAEQYWYYSPSAVRRSLFMDDVLYTVSATTVKMNDIKTVEDIGEIDLPYRESKYYDYPWWY